MLIFLRYAGLALGAFAITVIVYDAVKIVRALRASEAVTRNAGYTKSPDNPRYRLLVLGDSTAVGTGAKNPEDSVAGRVAGDVASLQVENHARNGALTQALSEQISDAERDRYDAILVQVGGNDILRWTSLSSLRESLALAFDATAALSDRVVLIVPGLVGNAPAIPWPLSYLLNHRSNQVRQICKEIAEARGVFFVDLLAATSPDRDNLAQNAAYAKDGLHPSGRGYARWYAALRAQVPLMTWFSGS